MYERILVPLDGSTFSESALDTALAVARHTGAALRLVTVIEPISTFALDGWEPAAHEWCRDYLDAVRDRVEGSTGGSVETAVLDGHVVETLLADAADAGADLIVLASHGRGAVSRAWLGSAADGIVRHADAAVLVVRPREDRDSSAGRADASFGTVLVPLDGSDVSESALEHATAFGELFGAAYHLVRVVSAPMDFASPYLPTTIQISTEILEEAKVTAAAYLEERAERLRKRGLRVTTSVVVDTQAGRGILGDAESVGCDVIAMATHGRTGLGRIVLGSTTDKVLRGSHVPLLLHRAPA